MTNLIAQVDEFNRIYKSKDIRETPTIPTVSDMNTFGTLIIEELQELADAHVKKDPKEFLDALADILYVTAQQARLYGWPIQEALDIVHESNLSKLGEDGKPIIREDGKVLKGPGFKEPDFEHLLENVIVEEDNG